MPSPGRRNCLTPALPAARAWPALPTRAGQLPPGSSTAEARQKPQEHRVNENQGTTLSMKTQPHGPPGPVLFSRYTCHHLWKNHMETKGLGPQGRNPGPELSEVSTFTNLSTAWPTHRRLLSLIPLPNIRLGMIGEDAINT